MRNRKEQIKRRIEKRKKQKNHNSANSRNITQNEGPLFSPPTYYDHSEFEWDRKSEIYAQNKIHPLFNKEAFIFKVLASACLVLIVAILFQNPSSKLDDARATVKNVMEKEFQFAAVAIWYEDTFGKPLALLPDPSNDNGRNLGEYALPANARILKNFNADKQGVIIQTVKDAPVEAVQEGMVRFAGYTDELGYTVIIQHPDTSETWYGKLSEVTVKDYDMIKAGDPVGKVSEGSMISTGEFYFAIKKDEQFIDPVQVIKFD